jgi:hypothetical protein
MARIDHSLEKDLTERDSTGTGQAAEVESDVLPESGALTLSAEATEEENPEILEHINVIRQRTAQTVECILDIARRLNRLKELLPHGRFLEVCEKELGYSSSSVNRFMRVYAVFADRDISHNGQFVPTALYLLSQKKVSEEVREEAIRATEQGVIINADWVRERVSPGESQNGNTKKVEFLSKFLNWLKDNSLKLKKSECTQILDYSKDILAIVDTTLHIEVIESEDVASYERTEQERL